MSMRKMPMTLHGASLERKQDVCQGLSRNMLQQAEGGLSGKDSSYKRGTCFHRSKMRSQLERRHCNVGRSRRPHRTNSERLKSSHDAGLSR
jgi:hypothetical protein